MTRLSPQERKQLALMANEMRRLTLEMYNHSGHGHFGGSFSAADIIAVLYGRVLRVDPKNPSWPERDRFVLSKGHACPTHFAALALRGFFPLEDLETFENLDSPFSTHPNMRKVPGVDMSTGSLGHGLPVAVGMALAAKLDAASYRTYALVGDGELEEGSNWEAAMFASRFELDNLTVIVDRNRLQVDGLTEQVSNLEPLHEKWKSFGWTYRECDGHDVAALVEALEQRPVPGKPTVIVASTVKGKGVSFMENRREWHGHGISPDEYRQALEELAEAKEAILNARPE